MKMLGVGYPCDGQSSHLDHIWKLMLLLFVLLAANSAVEEADTAEQEE